MFFSLVNSETPVVELDALSALLLGDGEELVHVSGEGVLGGEEGGLGLEAVLVGGVAHFDGLALGGQEPAEGKGRSSLWGSDMGALISGWNMQTRESCY